MVGRRTSRNAKTLADFTDYCVKNPEQRFWQALRNWSGSNFVIVAKDRSAVSDGEDTFYREGK